MLEGIDVSDHNGSINWALVQAAGISFAYIKATEGVSFTARTFAQNWRGAKDVGIVRGAYHYWRPEADAVAQIEHFHSVYPQWQVGELPPCLDLECNDDEYLDYTAQQLIDHAVTCVQTMEKLYGMKPMIYTYPYFYTHRLNNVAPFKDCPLWLAAYPKVQKPLPGGWQSVTLHQYSATGPAVNGVYAPKRADGGINLDLNRFYGTKDDLNRLCGIVPIPPAPAGSRYFPETKHYIGHGFRDKWEEYEKLGKALEVIGFPITEEMAGDNGQTVQYFERSRMEYVPPSDAGGAGVVGFGLVGKEAAAARGIQV